MKRALLLALALSLAACGPSTRELIVRDAGVSSNAHAVIITDQQATADSLYRLEQDQVVFGPGSRESKILAVDKVRVAWAKTFALLDLARSVHRRLAGQVVSADSAAIMLNIEELRGLETWIGASIEQARNRIVRKR